MRHGWRALRSSLDPVLDSVLHFCTRSAPPAPQPSDGVDQPEHRRQRDRRHATALTDALELNALLKGLGELQQYRGRGRRRLWRGPEGQQARSSTLVYRTKLMPSHELMPMSVDVGSPRSVTLKRQHAVSCLCFLPGFTVETCLSLLNLQKIEKRFDTKHHKKSGWYQNAA